LSTIAARSHPYHLGLLPLDGAKTNPNDVDVVVPDAAPSSEDVKPIPDKHVMSFEFVASAHQNAESSLELDKKPVAVKRISQQNKLKAPNPTQPRRSARIQAQSKPAVAKARKSIKQTRYHQITRKKPTSQQKRKSTVQLRRSTRNKSIDPNIPRQSLERLIDPSYENKVKNAWVQYTFVPWTPPKQVPPSNNGNLPDGTTVGNPSPTLPNSAQSSPNDANTHDDTDLIESLESDKDEERKIVRDEASEDSELQKDSKGEGSSFLVSPSKGSKVDGDSSLHTPSKASNVDGDSFLDASSKENQVNGHAPTISVPSVPSVNRNVLQFKNDAKDKVDAKEWQLKKEEWVEEHRDDLEKSINVSMLGHFSVLDDDPLDEELTIDEAVKVGTLAANKPIPEAGTPKSTSDASPSELQKENLRLRAELKEKDEQIADYKDMFDAAESSFDHSIFDSVPTFGVDSYPRGEEAIIDEMTKNATIDNDHTKGHHVDDCRCHDCWAKMSSKIKELEEKVESLKEYRAFFGTIKG